MIKGYDDHNERAAKGLPPYTHEGLVNKINALNDELDAARSETGRFRDELTEILRMDWPGGICPDDKEIIGRVRRQANQIKKLQAAILKERFWAIWRKGKHTNVNEVTELAKKQLRTEMSEEM